LGADLYSFQQVTILNAPLGADLYSFQQVTILNAPLGADLYSFQQVTIPDALFALGENIIYLTGYYPDCEISTSTPPPPLSTFSAFVKPFCPKSYL
jgi:hypothetical protein